MRGIPVRFGDFHFGLNSNDAAYLLQDGQARDCLNVVSTTKGAIQIRNGCTTFSSTGDSSPYNSLYALETFDGAGSAVKFLIAVSDAGVMYKINSSGTRTSIKSGLNANTTWEFCSFPSSATPGSPGFLFGVNAKEATPYYWNPSNASATVWSATSGTVPNGKYIAFWQDRLWIAGTGTNSSRLYYSNVADAFAWADTQTVDFDAMDGEPITGLVAAGPYLLVFKESKMWAVYDIDPDLGPSKRVISRNIGTCSHRSVVDTPRGTLFLTPDKGIWSTDGSSARLMSSNISPDTRLNAALRSQACAAYINDHYYLSLPQTDASTANNITLDYDTVLDSWWKHSAVVQQWATWRPTSSSSLLLYGARKAAVSGTGSTATWPGIDQMFASGVKQDNGIDFTGKWVSAWHSMGVPHIKKRFRRMRFDGSGTINTYLATDFSLGWNPFKTLSLTTVVLYAFGTNPASFGAEVQPFGAGVTTAQQNVFGVGGDINALKTGVARTLSIKFEASSSNGMQINAYTIAVTKRKN